MKRKNVPGKDTSKCLQIGFTKAGPMSEPLYNTGRKYFYIQCSFYPKNHSKAFESATKSFGYETKEEASDERELFRFAVARDNAKYWQQPKDHKQNGTDALHRDYEEDFSKITGRRRGDECLDASQLSQLQSMRTKSKVNGESISREMFSFKLDPTVFSKEDIERFQRSVSRPKEVKLTRTEKMYMVNNAASIKVLHEQRIEQIAAATLLGTAYFQRNNCETLIIRRGELSPRKIVAVDDFSGAQVQRVTMQTQPCIVFYRKEQKNL